MTRCEEKLDVELESSLSSVYSCKLELKTAVSFGDLALSLCEDVYIPAEDTWLLVRSCRHLLGELGDSFVVLVDVGSGTGVVSLSLLASMRFKYALLLDVDPCAAYCSLHNVRINKMDHLVDVAQCDNISCLRPLEASFIVYNTPYLPCTDNEEKPWSPWCGGLKESIRLAKIAGSWSCSTCCIAVTISSLSGDESELRRALASSGFVIIDVFKEHYFFEDIMVVVACQGTADRTGWQ